jgi:hypothetical protein
MNTVQAATASLNYSASATSNAIQLYNNITLAGSAAFNAYGPVVLYHDVTITTAGYIHFNAATGSYSATTIDGDSSGTRALILNSSSTIILYQAVGSNQPLKSLTSQAATQLIIWGDITSTGNISSTTPLTRIRVDPVDPLLKTRIIKTKVNGNVIINNLYFDYASTVLNITSAGDVQLNGVISENITAALKSLIVSAPNGTITQSSSLSSSYSVGDGSISYSANAIQLGGNISTRNNPVSLVSTTGPITLNAPILINTHNDVTATGANISFGALGTPSALEGLQNLTLRAGTGNVNFYGTVGSSFQLASLTVNDAATILQNSTVQTSGAISYTASNAINLYGNLTTSAGTVTFTGPMTFEMPTTITSNGGSVAFNGPAILSAGSNLQIFTNGGLKWLAKTGHKIGKNKLCFAPINKKK